MNSLDKITLLVVFFLIGLALITGSYGAVHSYQTESVNLFPHGNKLEEKLSTRDQEAERSFKQFIQSKPGQTTVIGEIKPNASELEMTLLKNKIASTIVSMQEMDRAREAAQYNQYNLEKEGNASECYIEVTRYASDGKQVEKVPGKCHKVNNGLPICQSESYMSINPDCS